MHKGSEKLSNSNYASRRKELLSQIQQLRAIGAQADLDLPRITVIGNQSAGKSSVVEAISGITVPRDAGTCTRCPMECRLSSSDGPWSCQVSIRWDFDQHGKRNDKVSEELFGTRITDKSKVEAALRRAQTAVLNPNVSFREILEMDIDDLKAGIFPGSLPFSRNVVCVDLEGPDLTDLSFIDLPGIIQNAEPEMVQLVEDLVVSHIKGNSLILVALPMTDDIENQKALRLALKEDPDGKRTIGVITKPDALTAGSTKSRQLWLDIIEGRRHTLAHGYFCTRQPDDAERSEHISAAQARLKEKSFFENTSPWSTSAHQNRFGTQNLISRLSDLLVQVINNSLPKLRKEASKHLETCKSELGNLPTELDVEPATYMLNLITSLCGEVEQFARGGTNTARLIQENKEAFAMFKKAIRRTAPNFVPFVDAQRQTSPFENTLGGGLDREDLATERVPFYLDDMRRHIKKSVTRELPNSVPFDAKLTLIREFQHSWKNSVHICFVTIREATVKILEKCIEDKCKQYQGLFSYIRLFVDELVGKHEKSCLDFLHSVLEAELMPYTQNFHYLESTTDRWLAKYKGVRSGGDTGSTPQPDSNTPCPVDPTHVTQALSYLALIGLPGLNREDLGKLKPSDEYETELKVMAEVRAYFQVSYKRVIDNVPAFIDLKFVRAVAQDLQQWLIAKFELGKADANNSCQKYLAEDPNVVTRRTELMAQKTRLESVEKELFRFGL